MTTATGKLGLGNIVYSQGRPYGAPLVMIRGGATKVPKVKEYLKEMGFEWDSSGYRAKYAWATYAPSDEWFAEVLRHLRDMGCVIKPKEGMRKSYIVEGFE